MNLPTKTSFEQGTAHFWAAPRSPLSLHSAPCKAKDVMVAHIWAQSFCSVRYPSPAGRCSCPQGCAPCFFPATGGDNSLGGDLATRPLMPTSWRIGAAKTARNKPRRGKETCEHSQNGLRPSAPQHFSRAAAKHSPNKRSWEQGQALALQLSPKAIWPLERSLAPSAMWPTARNSRHAVKRVTAALSGARHNLKAMSERSSGVAFFMYSGACSARLKRLNEEGTNYV